jgi:hypothetical protein
MKVILFSFVLFLLLCGCRTSNNYLITEEQNKLFQIVIKIEEDSGFSLVTRAKHGFNYMVGEEFIDSIYLDSNIIHLVDKNIDLEEIQKQYKKSIKESNKLISDSFDMVRIVQFSNKTPEFLSFSKPIKYLQYYFINIKYNSWSSGYSSFLVFEKKGSDNFKILYRSVYRVT